MKEAKDIVGAILDWQFVLMGVKEREEVALVAAIEKYSLEDLLKANKLVQSNNSRKEKLQKFHAAKGHKSKGISIQMRLADRIIAAVYTALHFKPNGEMIALMNDVGVGCVKVSYSD